MEPQPNGMFRFRIGKFYMAILHGLRESELVGVEVSQASGIISDRLDFKMACHDLSLHNHLRENPVAVVSEITVDSCASDNFQVILPASKGRYTIFTDNFLPLLYFPYVLL